MEQNCTKIVHNKENTKKPKRTLPCRDKNLTSQKHVLIRKILENCQIATKQKNLTKEKLNQK